MSLFAYQLAKRGKDVILESRESKSTNGLPVVVFTTIDTVKAVVCTVRGVKVFDNTNTEQEATHKFCLVFIDGITFENFVRIGTKRFRILSVDNCCENDEKLILFATQRGLDSKEVNAA